jgi:NAD(P)-dependent dehydrogenase (short-subunit alcohol dehydrogenase family)
MVTGAIGKAIARQLAGIESSEVVLVCRDKRKAEQVVNEIIEITGDPNVRFDLADLSRHKDIRESVGYALPTKLARQ